MFYLYADVIIMFRADSRQIFLKGVWCSCNNGSSQNSRTHRTRLSVSDESRMTNTVCGCRIPDGSAPVRLCSPVWICSGLTADISPGRDVLTHTDWGGPTGNHSMFQSDTRWLKELWRTAGAQRGDQKRSTGSSPAQDCCRVAPREPQTGRQTDR